MLAATDSYKDIAWNAASRLIWTIRYYW